MIELILAKILKAIVPKLIYIGIGFLIACLLFATLCKSKPQTVTMEVPVQDIQTILRNAKTLQKVLSSAEFPKQYIIKTEYDTFYVDSSTPYGDVPVVETSWDTTYTLLLNQQKKNAKMKFTLVHKGEVFEHIVTFHPTVFTVDVPGDKPIRLCGTVGLGYLNSGSIYAPAKLGLLFKERISLSGVTGYCNDWYVGGLLEAHFSF